MSINLGAIAEDGTRTITGAELLAGLPELGSSASIVSFYIQSGAGSLESHGDSTWTYRPAPNDDTSVSFALTATNGTLTSSATALLDMTPVNDAPVLTPFSPGLATITEDDTNNAGQTVASIIGTSIADPDGASVPHGIAITGSQSVNGHWEYSIDDGCTWSAFGSYSTTSALLLDETSKVRFVPDGLHGGSSTFTYVAWDETVTFGSTTGVTPGGGTTPYSMQSDTAHIAVTDVNDAPTLGHVADSAGYTELAAGVTVLSGITVADVDNNLLASATIKIADGLTPGDALSVHGATSGTSGDITWAYNADTGILSLTGAAGKADYQSLLAQVQFSSSSHDPTALGAHETRSIAWQVNDGTDPSAISTTTIHVTGIDDPPVASPVDLGAIDEDTTRVITSAELLAGAKDVDSARLTVTGLSIASGNGALTDNSDGTWTYTPALNDNSAVTFAYIVSDGEHAASSSATLDLTPVNDPPTGVVLHYVDTISENTSTTQPVKVADIVVVDDDQGTNVLTLAGSDAQYFQIIGTELFLKAGTHLDYETKPTYNFEVKVSDPTIITNSSTTTGTIDDPQTLHIQNVSPETILGTAATDKLVGGSDIDIINGLASADSLMGLGGNDTLIGGAGNDWLIGGPGADKMYGGSGNDVFVITGNQGVGDTFLGGAGTDVLYAVGSGPVTLHGFNAHASSIEIWHGNGNAVWGTASADVFNFAGLTSMVGLKCVLGGGGNDWLIGSNFADVFRGGPGNDHLIGNAGNDWLYGDAGHDVLTGSWGRDVLTGGADRDVFDFNSILDSRPGATRDIITDFHHGNNVTGDVIDLRDIDAMTGVGGNQAFKWIGAQAFHHQKGELHYVKVGPHALVEGDVNGDGHADFQILVMHAHALTSGDFIL